jgi:ABC-2 type transport system permease protein
MFRSVFSKSLRDYRVAILGWGIGLGLLVYFYYATILSQLAGSSSAQLQQIAEQFSFFGETVEANTPGGYITFKIMGSVPVVLGIWAVLAGARMTRGEEESGALDILLATPQSRASVLVQKVLALAVATGLISLLVGVLVLAGMASAHGSLPAEVAVDPGAALMAGVNAGISAFLFGALALLLAQFMGRGAAAGWAGGLMALSFIVEGTGRAITGASGVRPFSPLYYYDKSLPLVPGHGMNWGAFAVLVVLAVLLAGVAVPLFLRRDIGRSVLADATFGRGVRRATRPAGPVLAQADREVWLRGVGLQALRRQGAAMFWWILSLAIAAGYLVVVAKSIEKQFADLLHNNPTFQQILGGANVGTNAGFLSVIVFTYLPVILPVFAAVLAYHWAADLDRGRLELLLSTPQSRWRVILERYAAVLAATVLAALAILLAVVLFAAAAGFTLDVGRVTGAAIGMVPPALVAASLVFALGGLVPPAANIGIVVVVLAASFVADLLRTVFHLPDWALSLSIFHDYGRPVLTGLDWGAFAGMLVVAALILGLGGWRFNQADVDRGA